MSSILTNNSAMVALQTLRNVNSNLNGVQEQISTGKAIGSAKDNAAVFAISQVMQSDVEGFKAVSESISLGKATLSVGSNAAEAVGSLLDEIKGKIVAANEDNVDRGTLQQEITSLRDQITGVVAAAQFNGLNLIDGSTEEFSTLASLDRDAAGNVSTTDVVVSTATTNLGTDAGLDVLAGGGIASDLGASGDIEASGGTDVLTIDTLAFQGGGAAITTSDGANAAPTDASELLAGDLLELTIGTTRGTYTVKEGDTEDEVLAGLASSLAAAGLNSTDYTVTATAGSGELTVLNNTAEDITFSFETSRGGGGLSGLSSIDVSTEAGAEAALVEIESLVQNVTNAQAALGTGEKRLQIQDDFMSTLIDSFNSGIGSLVDADMEEVSAKLQALQVQQQLATQSLSIANQSPQSILSLFR